VKTVQTLSGVQTIAQQPKRCAQDTCAGFTQVWPAAQWQRQAPRGCTYGYEVIAAIGWQRQTRCERFSDIHAALTQRATPIQISLSQVRYLYHQQYLPLLACHERQHLADLRALGHSLGLLLALDGLAPEGGEPQLWVVRELRSGLTLRSGWLSTQAEESLANFLQPIADLDVPIRAVVSDKQHSLVRAVARVFPHSPHQFCQLHFLDNAAAPIAAADEAMKITLRQIVRDQVGELVRQEQAKTPGILTVTGLLPSAPAATETPPPSAAPPPTSAAPVSAHPPAAETVERECIVRDLLRRVRYLLTLKGRPPFRLAGIEMFERLEEVEACVRRLVQHHPDERLTQLQVGLHHALHVLRADYAEVCQAADWLEAIADVLDPLDQPARTGAQVRQSFENCLREIVADGQVADSPCLQRLAAGLDKVARSFAPGLFHCYDVPGLPRTNNARESEFRDLVRRLQRTTGQKGAVRRILQREGAWELIPRPASLEDTIRQFSQVPPAELAQERQRVRAHRDRFRLHTRSAHHAQRQLKQLERQWRAIPTSPGPE
jgi:hypothetical protein